MRIAIDVMGGDKAPDEILRGTYEAASELGIEPVLVGDSVIIWNSAVSLGFDPDRFEIVHTDERIMMDDDPVSVVRSKKRSSITLGLNLLRDGEADAFVSAGNTGALHVGSSLIVRKIKGVLRSGIGTVLPLAKPVLLLDSGANTDVIPEYLLQWALMGIVYMNRFYGIADPSVGLLNNGSEKTKGKELEKEAFVLLSEAGINFKGNIEARDIPLAPCDIIVTDGFTGNIVLKLCEGIGLFFFSEIKNMYKKSKLSELSSVLVREDLRNMREKYDFAKHGGAPFLGISKPVIKAHGSSDATAFKNAIRQAVSFAENDVVSDIENIINVYRKIK